MIMMTAPLIDAGETSEVSRDDWTDNNNNNDDMSEDEETAEVSVSQSYHSMSLCQVGNNRKLVLLNPALFLRKTALIILASYSLLPLLLYKSSLPGALYASLLIVIHVGVLIVYVYKVRFRDLDVDRLSLGGRVLGLVTVIWLLTVVSGWQDHDHVGILAVQMLVLCLVHTVVLAFLMVAIERISEPVPVVEPMSS